MTKFLSGMVFIRIIKLILYLISTSVKLIANIMVFFGLYIPFFYVIFGCTMYLFMDFRLFPYSADAGLFYFGLGLCVLCSIIITVRNVVIKPFKAVLGRDDREYAERYVPIRKPMPYSGGRYPRPRRISPPMRSKQYGYLRIDSPNEYIDRLDSYYERPEVYRSERNPDIIVYEYRDRFDLYSHNGNYLEFIESKYR